ncbi:MAG: hypothetical protein CL606_04535 [Anaerolineaceae bacterium]|nr:hypothetical protein [Anaerolineaceae bacterium]|tara:strand:+ start:8210 stop:8929 length:720 start_codon:yes stop_codon:yes gene_type:complete
MVIDFVESYEDLLYVCIGLAALWYLRVYLSASHKLRIGTYIVERETAIREKMWSLSIVIVLVGLIGLVYFGARRELPTVDTILLGSDQSDDNIIMITKVPTVTPDVVLLLPGQPTQTGVSADNLVKQKNTQVPMGGVGCDNTNAVIYSPLPGAVLSGDVEVQGTADITDFAFYTLEISTVGDNWLTVYTQDTPVTSGVLGNWNASVYQQGEYAFRLVVYNAAGAYSKPCLIPIFIGSGP